MSQSAALCLTLLRTVSQSAVCVSIYCVLCLNLHVSLGLLLTVPQSAAHCDSRFPLQALSLFIEECGASRSDPEITMVHPVHHVHHSLDFK